MSKLVVTAMAAVAMLGLAGCGIQLERSTGLSVTGGAFDQSLYDNYIARSRHEYNEGHYLASDDFAVRAREAASGARLTPYRLQGREFPGDTVEDLRRARAELIEALAKSARSKAPQQAGRAQVMFDCWVEEQEENRQPEDIAHCRGNLRDALDQIQQALAPQAEPEVEAEADVEQVAAIEPKPRFVHFAFDSAALDDRAGKTIDKVVEAARRVEAARISVTGHADRAGPEDYNMKLSIRRADAVRDALVDRGIPAERISVAGRGESEPLIPTGDGVRNRINRRAELIIQ